MARDDHFDRSAADRHFGGLVLKAFLRLGHVLLHFLQHRHRVGATGQSG